MAGQRTMGTSLTLKKAGSETEDTILKHVTSIGEVSVETEEIDVTTLDSPNGAKDAGSTDVAINNCDDGQVSILQALFDSGEVRDWLITYPSGGKLTLKGYVSKIAFGEATTDGLMTANITLRLSDEPKYLAPTESED